MPDQCALEHALEGLIFEDAVKVAEDLAFGGGELPTIEFLLEEATCGPL